MADITATSTAVFNDLAPKAVTATHPVYQLFAPEWLKLAHVREGVGGFLDGTYLVAHPREWEDYTATNPRKPTKKLKARRNIACYENFAGTIIEAKKSALFREAVTRRVGQPPANGGEKPPTELEDWWQDVDGRGCHIDDYMAAAWDLAATFGHVYLLLDRSSEDIGARMAPYVRMYTPLDVLDWVEDDYGRLVQVKFQEPEPRTSLEQLPNATQTRVRIITETEWRLYDAKGKAIARGENTLGEVPVAPLFGRRRPLYAVIGQSVLGDPRRFIDLYNLTSEIRELLRNQTFSWINVPLGTGADAITVEQAKTMMGQEVGTNNVIFSGLAAGILSADAANVTVYQAEKTERLRAIYREAAIQWESDSKDAEAQGSLKLKREDMNTRLAMYADECEQTEFALARLWYLDRYGADAGEKKFESDDVIVRYPDTFDVTPFDVVLEQAQAAISLGYPTEVLKELRKALLAKFLPNLMPEEGKKLRDAIENAPDDLTPQEQAQLHAKATVAAMNEGKKPPANKAAA